MEIPHFNSQEMQNAENIRASLTSSSPKIYTVHELRDIITGILANKNYKLINTFEYGTLNIAPCTDEKQLFKMLFDSIKNHISANIESKDIDKLLITNKIFESITNLLDILAVQKITLTKDVIVAALLGILIKNL